MSTAKTTAMNTLSAPASAPTVTGSGTALLKVTGVNKRFGGLSLKK
jgi:hypothetical protein